MEVDKDFEQMAINELKYLCVRKWFYDLYFFNDNIKLQDIRKFIISVHNCKKEDLIMYLLNE